MEISLLQDKFGDEYQVYLKAHYFIYDKLQELGLDDLLIPNWVDTNELLATVDTLITDYSSIFFDYLPLQRPIYFYMPDKEIYEEERGFYLDIEGLPGSKAYNLDELMDNISKYQDNYHTSFKKEIAHYLEEFCEYDNGIA